MLWLDGTIPSLALSQTVVVSPALAMAMETLDIDVLVTAGVVPGGGAGAAAGCGVLPLTGVRQAVHTSLGPVRHWWLRPLTLRSGGLGGDLCISPRCI